MRAVGFAALLFAAIVCGARAVTVEECEAQNGTTVAACTTVEGCGFYLGDETWCLPCNASLWPESYSDDCGELAGCLPDGDDCTRWNDTCYQAATTDCTDPGCGLYTPVNETVEAYCAPCDVGDITMTLTDDFDDGYGNVVCDQFTTGCAWINEECVEAPSSSPSPSGLSAGAWAGIGVAIAAVVGGAAVATALWIRHRGPRVNGAAPPGYKAWL